MPECFRNERENALGVWRAIAASSLSLNAWVRFARM